MEVAFKTTPYTRKFGVELEVSPDLHKSKIGMFLEDFETFFGSARSVRVTPGAKGWDETNDNSYWHVKYDSTCGPIGKPYDSGWEIASFIGKTQNDLNVISGAGEWLGYRGLSTNDNCGFHIHVDVSDFTPERVGLLIARWLKIEFYVMSACPSRRIINPYCQFLNVRKLTQNVCYDPLRLSKFWNDMAPRDLGVHDNSDKRYTVNTIGYRIGQMVDPMYSRQTVEFRFPECLLEKSHIDNWVRLLLCFVDDCKNAKSAPDNIQRSSLAEVLQFLGFKGTKDFFILDKELLETKIWFLKKIKKESSRTSYAKEAADLLAFMLEM
jgi:hypothetical protein